MAANVSTAYLESLPTVPGWLNKGDNAWQLIAATLVAVQGMPGLVILYGSIVKKKWAVNSAFMALYAFAAVLLLWVLVCYKMAFVPLWLIFSYTVGAFSLWGGGFLYHWGVIDFAGGYVIHLSSGVAGLTAAYWVGPRMQCDKERFPPNNVVLALAGAGLLWTGWSGFNGGAPYAANIDTSIAVLNTNICAATSLLMWTSLDVFYFGKPSVIGAIQGMITGLVCITPGAGVVQAWAAIVMGILAGSIPWFTMMILHKKSSLLQKVDDTLGVFHTHAVAGILGGTLTGLLAEPHLCDMVLPVKGSRGVVYGGTDDELLMGDDAAHGEEAYALWGDGERYDASKHAGYSPNYQQTPTRSLIGETGRGGAVGV
ncbi:ammonium transporter 2 member 2-like [Papaver somniferum]|uniref:ammonium transporter 2 member 2-like n=1 Tax=Papaver somniferum TaxID=3469 RepID=UPI000E70605C|nr:ammonium transporter 2 member 2-like [Papaver somniferum]